MKRISELIEGNGFFNSNGFSVIKVTKDGKESLVELPIRSTGVAEFQEELRDKAPKPPVRKEIIKKDSPEGKALGLTHHKFQQVFDTTDEEYLALLEAHNQDFIWKVIIFALDISLKKKDGTEANSFESKKRILQSTGLTGAHANQIFKDVQALTKVEDKDTDFLSSD